MVEIEKLLEVRKKIHNIITESGLMAREVLDIGHELVTNATIALTIASLAKQFDSAKETPPKAP